MKKIIVPTDFSSTAQAALDVAATIAKKSGGQLFLLHIIEGPSAGSFNVEGQVSTSDWTNKLFEMKLIETSRNKLNKVADQMTQAGVSVKTVLRLGDPFHGIRATIAEQKADLIVMGTTGIDGTGDTIVGSNTERVVRRAECPVLAIPAKQTKNDFSSIVYATTMSDEEKGVIDVLKNAQQMFDSSIHMLRVNTPGAFEADGKVLKAMAAFAKKMQLKNFTLNTISDWTEEAGIGQFGESLDAGLIVMGTHTRTALSHLLSRSIAETVVNRSKIPVLTYHMKEKK